MTIYLYKKIHNKTGLQYLGKTSKDPYAYSGSGIDWKNHLHIYGNDVTTFVLKECSDNQELSYWGRYYSQLWDIVDSNEWANRIPETGGGTSPNDHTRKKLRESQLGKSKPRSPEHQEKIAAKLRGRKNHKNSIRMMTTVVLTEVRDKQAKSLKEWYASNQEQATEKARKAWKTRYEKDLEKYLKIIELINSGYNNRNIIKCVKIDNDVLTSLRNKTHPILTAFPMLIEKFVGT